MGFCHRSALLVTSGYRWALYIRPNDPRESRIPKELVESAYRLVSSRSLTKRKQHINFGTVQGVRNVSQYSTSSAHAHLDTNLLEQIRGQLVMLVSQTENHIIAEAAMSQRLNSLANQLEALRQEVNNQNYKKSKEDSMVFYDSNSYVIENNISNSV